MAPPPPNTPAAAAAAAAAPPPTSRARTSSNAAAKKLNMSTNAAGGMSGGPATPTTTAIPQLVEHKVHYTVVVRLPFARGDFVDPAQVEWDATKDAALWKIISRPMSGMGPGGAGRREIDWQELATRFEVSPSFILQQAAWLYERHLSHVRAQMRKVGSGTAASGSGTVGGAAGGVPMKRGGSGGGVAGPRAPSSLSMRSRDSPVPVRVVSGTPNTGGQLSRTPSTTTITQSRLQQPQSPRQPLRSSFRSSFPPAPRRTSPTLEPTAERSRNQSRTVSPTSIQMSDGSDSNSSSSDDDQHNNPIRRSQVFKRPPRFMSRQAAAKPGLPRLDDVDVEYDDTTDYGDRAGDERSDGDDEDEDDDDEGFLPFAVPTRRRTANNNTKHHHHDQNATIRRNNPTQDGTQNRAAGGSAAGATRPPLSSIAAGKQPARSHTMDSSFTSASDARTTDDDYFEAAAATTNRKGGHGHHARGAQQQQENVSSTASSPAAGPVAAATGGRGGKRRAGTVTGNHPPLSPRHRAELARLGSPRVRGKEGGSEGTPSMGSSFSDLDDASVTQSALEEQLLSHMQHAGGLSKMSTISQALRSRYLP